MFWRTQNGKCNEALQSCTRPKSPPGSHLRGGKGDRAHAARCRYSRWPKPDSRISCKEPVRRSAGAGARRRVMCRRVGRDLREQAQIEMWNRRMELELFAAIGRTVQNTSSIFQGRFKQFADYGEAQRAVVYQRLERMDRELNGHRFVAGDRFTIADITALVAIDIGGRLADIRIAPELAHLTRWHETVSSRPSARA